MEEFDLHLKIGKKRLTDGFYPLTIVKADGEKYRTKLSIPVEIGDPLILAPSGHDLGSYLDIALGNEGLQSLLFDQNNLILATGPNVQGALLLEICAPDLYGLPWEDVFDYSPWSSLSGTFHVTRYLPRASTVMTKPLHLPIDALILSDELWNTNDCLPTYGAMQYLRSTTVRGPSCEYLRRLLRNMHYDIIHFIRQGGLVDKANKHMRLKQGELGIDTKELKSLLKRCNARLVVLDVLDDLGNAFSDVLELAHRIHHANGPTIVALQRPVLPADSSIDTIYYGIVHDEPIDSVIKELPSDWRVAMWSAQGGADVLSVSFTAPRIAARIAIQVAEAKNIKDVLEKKLYREDPAEIEALNKTLNAVDAALTDLGQALQPMTGLDFKHEGGGTVPFMGRQRQNA